MNLKKSKWLSGIFALAAGAALCAPQAEANLRTAFNDPVTLGGSHTAYAQGDSNTRADYDAAAYDKRSWEVYRNRRGDLSAQIAACRATSQCSPRFEAWTRLIDTIRRIRDPLLKAEIVNDWANSLILYTKRNTIFTGEYQRMQTPGELLDNDAGLCSDYAVLKYETLLRGGLRADQLHILTGSHTEFPGGTERHAVLMVSLATGNWILSNFAEDQPSLASSPEQLKRKFINNGGLVAAELYMDVKDKKHRSRFVPLLSQNETGAERYYKSADTTARVGYSTMIENPSPSLDRYLQNLAVETFHLRRDWQNGFPVPRPGA